jgi:hypothetical protein
MGGKLCLQEFPVPRRCLLWSPVVPCGFWETVFLPERVPPRLELLRAAGPTQPGEGLGPRCTAVSGSSLPGCRGVLTRWLMPALEESARQACDHQGADCTPKGLHPA